jgi:DNA relaxase NicK
MWDELLTADLGGYEVKDFGGRYYKRTVIGLLGLRVRYMPHDPEEYDRWTLELPGQACQILGIDGLKKVYNWFAVNCRHFQVARIDLAVNNCPFTPSDLYKAIEGNQVKTWIKRNTDLRWIINTRQKKDDGSIGTTGLEWGSRQSMRYLRCYDLHGYTRLEIEYKDKRADIVACDIFIENDTWQTVIKHVRDCLDVLDQDIEQIRQTEGTRAELAQHLIHWWAELIGAVGRANVRLGRTVREITMARVTQWLYHQVAVGLSVVADYSNYDIINDLLDVGRDKRQFSQRYAPLMACSL